MRLGTDAYADAELMQVAFSNALDRQEGTLGSGVSSIAIHPGFVVSDIDRESGFVGPALKFVRSLVARDTMSGAVTQVGSLWLSTA